MSTQEVCQPERQPKAQQNAAVIRKDREGEKSEKRVVEKSVQREGRTLKEGSRVRRPRAGNAAQEGRKIATAMPNLLST